MGWTSYHANHYYKNGTINRKAECDAYFTKGLNESHFAVVKSTMKGSVYYAAVKTLLRLTNNNKYEPIPESEQKIWAVVMLTSTNAKDYYNFSYKIIDETCGPCETECPESILRLLSGTDNEYALNWRNRCYENIQKKKEKKTLATLPIGTKIQYTQGERIRTLVKHPAAYQFKRPFWMLEDQTSYIPQKYIPDDFIIISQP